MLLFVKGAYLELIRQGRKTTTIRPWKVCSLTPGRVLSFNGKIRVRLRAVNQVPLADIDDQAAQADGFASRRAFLHAMRSHYPTLGADALVWVLAFDPPTNSSPHIARASRRSARAPK